MWNLFGWTTFAIIIIILLTVAITVFLSVAPNCCFVTCINIVNTVCPGVYFMACSQKEEYIEKRATYIQEQGVFGVRGYTPVLTKVKEN